MGAGQPEVRKWQSGEVVEGYSTLWRIMAAGHPPPGGVRRYRVYYPREGIDLALAQGGPWPWRWRWLVRAEAALQVKRSKAR
jgi:hypothetical protein